MSDALNDLRFLEKRFKGILELIPSLEKISSLGNQEKELTKTVSDLKKQYTDLQTKLSNLQSSMSDAEQAKEAILKEASEQGNLIIEDAKAKAEHLVSDAQKSADATIAGAQEVYTQLIQDQETAKKYMQDLNRSISELEAKKAKVEKDLADFKAKL